MASKADSSSNIASTTQESTRTCGLISAVQVHSRTALDSKDPAYRYCIHCTTDPIFKTWMAPTNLQSHLKSKHAIFVEVTLGKIQSKALEQLKELYDQAESSGQTKEIDAQVFLRQLDLDVVNKALVLLIVVQNFPF